MNRICGSLAVCCLLAAALARGGLPEPISGSSAKDMVAADDVPLLPLGRTGNPAVQSDDGGAASTDPADASGNGTDAAIPDVVPAQTVTPDPALLVSTHNKWRAAVGAPAVAWSDDVAAGAAQWAAQLQQKGCALEHSASGDGENLYWASPIFGTGGLRVQTVSSSDVVDSWGQEKQAYDPGANTCRAGQVCGHYTQVVWAKTTQVGCAAVVCTDRSQAWVCRYRPAGNMMGERPF